MSESTLDDQGSEQVAWFRILSPRASAELERAAGAEATVASGASDVLEAWSGSCSAQALATPAPPLDPSAAPWLTLSPRAVAGLAEATAPGYPLACVIAEIVEEWAGRSAASRRNA